MPATRNGAARKGAARRTYDQLKEFDGKRYTGMKVGRRHRWRYDAGDWTEKKVTPDQWEFSYSVVKRRAGKAPQGSGAPVGTAYRWYILAHQIVTKRDANSYTTEMAGLKYKLAHRRADKDTWSASDRAQRKRLVQLLHELIAELEEPEAPMTTAAAAWPAKPDGATQTPTAPDEPARDRAPRPRTKRRRPRSAADGSPRPEH